MQVNIGKGITLDVDTEALPEAAMSHVQYIGLRNILQDAHAGESNPDNARAIAEKKLAALMQGVVRSVGTRERDPVAARVNAITKKLVENAWRKEGRKVADLTPDARAKIASAFDPAKVNAMAVAQVAAEKSIADAADVADLIGG